MTGSAQDERAVAAVGPCDGGHPGGDRAEPVADAGEERDVDETPPEPPHDAGQLDRTGLQQGMATADIGRRAKVAVAEVLPHAAGEVTLDACGDVQTALHGVLRNPG